MRRHAAWVMDYCTKCYERRWAVRGPDGPLEEQVRCAATYCVEGGKVLAVRLREW